MRIYNGEHRGVEHTSGLFIMVLGLKKKGILTHLEGDLYFYLRTYAWDCKKTGYRNDCKMRQFDFRLASGQRKQNVNRAIMGLKKKGLVSFISRVKWINSKGETKYKAFENNDSEAKIWKDNRCGKMISTHYRIYDPESIEHKVKHIPLNLLFKKR